MNDKPQEELPRRDFLSWSILGILGIIAASAAFPLAMLGSRPQKQKTLTFFPAFPIDDMPETGIKKAELALRGGEKPDTRVFIKRDASGSLTAFSAVCTHLGCLVNYNGIKKEFICPCHAGKYDTDGNVISGPPPEGLKKLPVKVEGERVIVGFEV